MSENFSRPTPFALLLSITTTSFAQFEQFGVKAGFALGEPLDDNTSNMHLGFDVGITYDITEKIRAEILFETLTRSETIPIPFFGSIETRSTLMPITIGGEYRFVTGKIQPYAGLNVGLYRLSAEVFGQSQSDSYIGFAPKVGLSFEVTENISVEATAKYHYILNKDDNNAGIEGFTDIDGNQIEEQPNTTVFGANIGLIYKFN